jgi:hypothetical protein
VSIKHLNKVCFSLHFFLLKMNKWRVKLMHSPSLLMEIMCVGHRVSTVSVVKFVK